MVLKGEFRSTSFSEDCNNNEQSLAQLMADRKCGGGGWGAFETESGMNSELCGARNAPGKVTAGSFVFTGNTITMI